MGAIALHACAGLWIARQVLVVMELQGTDKPCAISYLRGRWGNQVLVGDHA